MSKLRNTFVGGLDRDTEFNKFNNSSLFNASNIRILSEDNNSNGSITNIRGTESLTINDDIIYNNYSIIGAIYVRDDIVLFYAGNTHTIDNTGSIGYIDLLKSQGDGTYTRYQLWNGAGLNFRIDKPITGLGRYENSSVIKIYWTDNNENVRYANIAPDLPGGTTFTRINAYNAYEFELLQNIDFSIPQFNGYVGGNYLTGIVQYCYQLVKENGSVSIISPLSELIPLSSTITENNTKGLYGSEIESFTGTGISGTINLSGYSLEYDQIKVISLLYTSKDTNPIIRVVNYYDIDSVINFVDTGTTFVEDIDIEEFGIIQNDFSAKTLATKDDILFAGNITETVFDVEYDARSYRYSNIAAFGSWAGGHASVIFDNNGDTMLFNDATTSNWDLYTYNTGGKYFPGNYTLTTPAAYTTTTIPFDYDCINIYNDRNYDTFSTAPKPNRNKGDSLDGGTGINVSYSFVTDSFDLDDNTSNIHINTGIDSGNKEQFLGLKRNYKRGETYRFGLVFFDEKGRSSTVKWIGDVRFPTIVDDIAYAIATGGSTTNITGYNLGINFTVSNVPAGLAYMIVRTPRTYTDKTVLAQGVISHMIESTSSTIRGTIQPRYLTTYPSYTPENQVIDFISPEVNFYNNISPIGTDRVQAIGYLNNYNISKLQPTWSGNEEIKGKYTNHTALTPTATLHYRAVDEYNVFRSFPAGELGATVPSDVGIVRDYLHWGETGTGHYGAKGTCAVITLDNAFVFTDFSAEELPIVDYIRDASQYGGNSYQARLNNVYLQASDINSGISYRGDTHICMYDYLRNIYDAQDVGDTFRLQYILYFPVETEINLRLRHDRSYSRKAEKYLTELKGIYPTETAGEFFEQETDLYLYNKVYSTDSTITAYIPNENEDLGLYADLSYDYDTKVKYSNVKVNGEYSDSWTFFKPNNFKQLDTEYGQLNKLINFNTDIYCFQNSGFALASINPRVTQVGSDGITTILGTGATIDRFQYISTEIGAGDNTDVVKSLAAMYWIDTNKRKVYTYGGEGLISLSDVANMSSFFRNSINYTTSMIGVYDSKNTDILFSVSNTFDNSLFTATLTAPTEYTLTGISSTNMDMRVGVSYYIGGGRYTLASVTPTTLVFNYFNGTTLNTTPGSNVYDLSEYLYNRTVYTIAYNEKVQRFTSFYTFLPYLYLRGTKEFYMVLGTQSINKYSDTIYNDINGTIYPSYFDIIITDGSNTILEYNNLDFYSKIEQFTNSINEIIGNETVTSVKVWNDEQESDEVDLLPYVEFTKEEMDTSNYYIDPTVANYSNLYNIRKTATHWHTAIPRYKSNNGDKAKDLTSDRIRSAYMRLRIKYLPDSNTKKFTLKDLITTVQQYLL